MSKHKGDAIATQTRIAEILRASTLVFGKYGYNGGSLSQIAKHLEISESGILHHFKTKANLLAEVLKLRDEENMKRSGGASQSGLGFVVSWLSTVKFNISDPGNVELFCIISAEATSASHPAHEYFRARYTTTTHFASESFKNLAELGYLRTKENPIVLGQTLVALSDGMQVQWLLDRSCGMLEHHESFFSRVLTDEAAEMVGLNSNNQT